MTIEASTAAFIISRVAIIWSRKISQFLPKSNRCFQEDSSRDLKAVSFATDAMLVWYFFIQGYVDICCRKKTLRMASIFSFQSYCHSISFSRRQVFGNWTVLVIRRKLCLRPWDAWIEGSTMKLPFAPNIFYQESAKSKRGLPGASQYPSTEVEGNYPDSPDNSVLNPESPFRTENHPTSDISSILM